MKHLRFITADNCGLRVREEEGKEGSRTVVGAPIVFGVRSVNLTPWSDYREVYEVIEPGAITDELLRESDVVLNVNHSNKVTDILGRFRGNEGTLSLELKEDNVEAACDLPNTNCGNDTLELIKRGDINGMSFAFEDDWEDSENGVSYERMREEDHDGKEVWLRHVKRITALYDVSIVTHPAYEQTSVESREIDSQLDKVRQSEAKAASELRKQIEEAEAQEKREAEEKAAEEQARIEQEQTAMRDRQRTRRHLEEIVKSIY